MLPGMVMSNGLAASLSAPVFEKPFMVEARFIP